MKSIYNKATTTFQSRGVRALITETISYVMRNIIAPVYGQYLTSLPPFRMSSYNGIDVCESHLPGNLTRRPTYESGIITALEKHIQPDDKIVIVGGGYGVTAVKAAQLTGSDGMVTVFEASTSLINPIKRTIKYHNLDNIVDVHHTVVGSGISVYGEKGDPVQITPAELPECDLLELDCEGAEMEILSDLTDKPKVIIVETHGIYNSPSNTIQSQLEDMSYTIVSKAIADSGKADVCVENDIYVLTAILEKDKN